MVSQGTGDRHLQGSPRLGLHPGDNHVHTGGYAKEDQVWIQNPSPYGGRSEAVWRKYEEFLHWGSVPGTSSPAPDPQPAGKPDVVTPSVNNTTDQ